MEHGYTFNFLRASSKIKSFSKAEQLSVENSRALLQNSKGVGYDLPIGIFQRLQRASLTNDTSRTIVNAGHMAQEAKHLAWQTELVAGPSLILAPNQNQQLFESVGKWFRVTHLQEEYIVSIIQKDPLGLCLSLAAAGVRCNSLPFTSEEILSRSHTLKCHQVEGL